MKLKLLSLSSASITATLDFPNIKFDFIFLSIAPKKAVISQPEFIRSWLTKLDVVLLPWVPAIQIFLYLLVNLPNASPLDSNLIFLDFASLYSSFDALIADEYITRSCEFILLREWLLKILIPIFFKYDI